MFDDISQELEPRYNYVFGMIDSLAEPDPVTGWPTLKLDDGVQAKWEEGRLQFPGTNDEFTLICRVAEKDIHARWTTAA